MGVKSGKIPVAYSKFDTIKYRVVHSIEALKDFDYIGATTLAGFLEENWNDIEDIFIGNDEVFILPKTEEFADQLEELVYDPEDDGPAISDEFGWEEDNNGHYWLWLWWD